MTVKRKHLYVSFINWGDGGEIHLRKCDVSWEDDKQDDGDRTRRVG
jgi:hypothetical protein